MPDPTPEQIEAAAEALWKQAPKIVDGEWATISEPHKQWFREMATAALTAAQAHKPNVCVTCGHPEPHTGGGIGVCLHEGCGCDGPVKTAHQQPQDAEGLREEVERLRTGLEGLLSWAYGGNRYIVERHRFADHECAECKEPWPCPVIFAHVARTGGDCTDLCSEMHTFDDGCVYSRCALAQDHEGEEREDG